MKVLAAMSGGVDSSVAAALLVEAGHDVVGVTLKLWGGESDTGCCSVADVDDARRVADRLRLAHHVFNLADAFDEWVVDPYVRAHVGGRTPNPCIECNRSVKFGLLFDRARRLGFDALATGHHARVVRRQGGWRLMRGADPAKDQSYVLAMLTSDKLERLLFPVGEMTKSAVRERATDLGLGTATKPDSQDVCFIHTSTGRHGFLSSRMQLHRGRLVDAASGEDLGTVPALELVTLGQRRGLGADVTGRRRYALSVDVPGRKVVVGGAERAIASRVRLEPATWISRPLRRGDRALAQTSAHGKVSRCTWDDDSIVFDEPQRLVAPGQTVALYDTAEPDSVLGSAVAR